MHCWKPEMPSQKKAAREDLAQLNKIFEPHMRADWEVKQEALQASKKKKWALRSLEKG